MSQPASEPRRLDPAQARRMVNALSLRPNEQVLCLGPDGGAIPSVAAILVGPTGRIVEADRELAAAGGTLPYPDGEFDAVAIDLATPDTEQTHLLGEVARVTAPTGRVTFAVSRPADGNLAPVRQRAERAGLRGIAHRPDPSTESGSAPVEFVTAFPPAPAKPADDADNTAAIHLPESAGQPGRPRRRHLLLVGATAALVVAAVVAVAWGLAGTEPGDDAPAGRTDLLAGDAELDIDQPGTQERPAVEDAPARGGPTADDSDSASSSGSSGTAAGTGSSPGSSGDGEPDNQPPVIEDMNLSADGLALSVLPIVSDPDGDEVSLDFEVEGAEPRIAPSGDRARATFSYDDVGERHEATVTVTATDTHGASGQQTATLVLVANYGALVEDLRFTVLTRECFGEDEAPQQLMATVQFDGPRSAIGSQLRVDFSDVVLRDRYRTNPSLSPIELEVFVEITFVGATRTHRNVLSDDESVMYVFVAPGECRALVTYDVEFIRF